MQFPRDRTSWLARKQGDWQPGMPTFISFVILGLFTAQGANRGVDYITGDRPDVTKSLTVVEQAMPLHYWGALFLIASTVVAAGMLSVGRRSSSLGAYALWCCIPVSRGG